MVLFLSFLILSSVSWLVHLIPWRYSLFLIGPRQIYRQPGMFYHLLVTLGWYRASKNGNLSPLPCCFAIFVYTSNPFHFYTSTQFNIVLCTHPASKSAPPTLRHPKTEIEDFKLSKENVWNQNWKLFGFGLGFAEMLYFCHTRLELGFWIQAVLWRTRVGSKISFDQPTHPPGSLIFFGFWIHGVLC